jgi:hypothetical protein
LISNLWAKQDPNFGEVVWPEERPLPFPIWGTQLPEEAHFNDVTEYEGFAGLVELVSQQTVAAHKYNTTDNFIRFYRAFKKSKIDSLDSFYREYQPPITPCHYTCVGLAYELIYRLNNFLPQHLESAKKFYLVSCEESIETIGSYVENVPPDKKVVEKEHVLVCLKIRIGDSITGRQGFLLLDPGYHVSRVVTVMQDGLYPNTGLFTQGDDQRVRKEYEYTWMDQNYIGWSATETKKGIQECYTSLIYVRSAFLSAIDVAERRNLVYDFKSILRRDPKGNILAGLYFAVNPQRANVTLFYMNSNKTRHTMKLALVKNFKDTPEIRECEFQMGLKKGKLLLTLNALGRIVHDEGFVSQLLRLNENILSISAEN